MSLLPPPPDPDQPTVIVKYERPKRDKNAVKSIEAKFDLSALDRSWECSDPTLSAVLELCRIHRPRTVVEIGTWPGRSGEALAAWCATSGAVFITYEQDKDKAAQMIAAGLPCWGWPPCFDDADLLFIDLAQGTQPSRRQLVQQWLKESPKGSVCIVEGEAQTPQIWGELRKHTVTVKANAWVITKGR